MSDLQSQLNTYENQMRLLVQVRNERRRTAELAMKRADVEFDRGAIPLARKINRLREQLEDQEDQEEREAPAHREHRPKHVTHDPEWSQEEIDHFYELQRK